MFTRGVRFWPPMTILACIVALSVLSVGGLDRATAASAEDGVVKVKSAYGLDETIMRVKQDVADKGIMFFQQIDQAKLAADADIMLRPSTLLIFGNPPLGSLFMTANPYAGLDWPVRLLVVEDESGQVWLAYTDFDYIKRRHQIDSRDEAFKMASTVIASIASSVQAK
ncbi:MAG: DUF302 domain-containing protein [Kiloniellales bacterium]